MDSIRGGVAIVTFTGSMPNTTGAAETCKAARGTGNTILNPGTSGMGGSLGDAYAPHTTFSSVLPPNGPSCTAAVSNDYALSTANSFHPGGVNIALGDGSVRFVPETINCTTAGLYNSSTRGFGFSGPSPYGIWGELGTCDGGESGTSF